MELEPKHLHAPELYGDFWFNSEPVSLRSLLGQVILLDFWEYSSLSCARSVDYVKGWAAKYASYGLITVGVHTPQFPFGRNPELLGRAIVDAGITYPVVSDNDAIIWSGYAVRAWPTRCLIDKDGFIRFVQRGEGGYIEFERALQQLLNESGYRGEFPDLMEPLRDEDRPGALCHRPTGGLFLGYLRGSLANPEGYSPESTAEYSDPGLYLPERFYASGKWLNGRDSLRFDGNAEESGMLMLSYEAREVNAVMGSHSGKPCDVMISQDGFPITEELAGADVIPDSGGRVRVGMPRMYRMVRNKEFGPHQLRLATSAQDLEVYTISFTTSVIPEFVSKN